MATEEGIVTRTEAQTAWVKTTQSVACKSCASRGSCHSKGPEMSVEAINLAGAKAGDRIIISFETSSLLKASFLLYLFPILCMIAGAVIGSHVAPMVGRDPSLLSLIGGFLCFFLAVLFIKIKGNRMAETAAYKPKVTRILRRRADSATDLTL